MGLLQLRNFTLLSKSRSISFPKTGERNARNFTTQIKQKPPWNVLFFGSDLVSLKTLQTLRLNQLNPTATGYPQVVNHLEVVCPQEKAEDLIVPVKQFCIRNHIPYHHPIPSLKQWQVPSPPQSPFPFDIAVVVSFGYLIPTRIIESFPEGGINMHPSLLPRYRGAAPIYHTLLNDDKETGVSVIELSKGKFDVGRILHQVHYPIDPHITFGKLTDELASIGAEKILLTLSQLHEYKEKAVSQTEEGASKAPKISKELGYIDWNRHTAEDVYRLWRALGDTVGIHTKFELNQLRVRLHTLEPPSVKLSYKRPEQFEPLYHPGMLKYDVKQQLLFIRCANGGWIGCRDLQVENHKRIAAETFVNGYRFRNMKLPDTRHMFSELNKHS